MRYGIRTKLVAAFLMMLVPFAGIILLGAYDQGRIMDTARKVDMISAEIKAVLDLQIALHKALMPPNDFIITGDKRYYAQFKSMESEVELRFKRAEEMLAVLAGANPQAVKEEAKLLEGVKKNWAEVKRLSKRIFELKGTEAKRAGAELMEEMDYKWSYPALQKLQRWHMIDLEEHKEAIAAAETVRGRSKMITAIGISVFAGLGILFAYFYSGVFVRPITAMCLHSDRVSSGDFSSRAEVNTGDELEDLGRSMNSMAERLGAAYAGMEGTIEARTRELKAALENIRENEERLARILEQMPLPIEICSSDGTAVMVNRAFLDMFGLENAETIIGHFNIFKDEYVNKVLHLEEEIKKAYAGQTVFLPEVKMQLERIDPKYGIVKKGETVHEITIFSISSRTGASWGIMTLWKDISGRKKNEQALKERVEELELFRKVTIKRELRLRELKEKVFELQKKISAMEAKKA